MGDHRARQLMIVAGQQYPQAWKQMDTFRTGKGADLGDWPDWCYLPMAAFIAITSNGVDEQDVELDMVAEATRLNAVGIWRLSQGVYRFDPAVYESLKETKLDGKLPANIFYRLPEWCIYIETPDFEFCGEYQHGAFVYLEHDMNTGRPELRFLLDTDMSLTPIILHLGDWTIDEALERFNAEAEKQLGSAYVWDNKYLKVLAEQIKPTLSLLLYICSNNADFGDEQPTYPQPTKTKKGWRLFAPKTAKTWDVGVRLGNAIRKYKNAEETMQIESGSSPRPHVRRAHWHHFWTGPRDGDRELIVKWMPPIPVNIDDNELPTVIKKVE